MPQRINVHNYYIKLRRLGQIVSLRRWLSCRLLFCLLYRTGNKRVRQMKLTECNNVSVPFLREIWIVFDNIKALWPSPGSYFTSPGDWRYKWFYFRFCLGFFLYQCKRFLISVHFFGENDYFFLKENCSSNKMFPSFYTFNQSTQEKKNETILLWVYLCHLKMNYKTFF